MIGLMALAPAALWLMRRAVARGSDWLADRRAKKSNT